jgi:hypothetical protein
MSFYGSSTPDSSRMEQFANTLCGEVFVVDCGCWLMSQRTFGVVSENYVYLCELVRKSELNSAPLGESEPVQARKLINGMFAKPIVATVRTVSDGATKEIPVEWCIKVLHSAHLDAESDHAPNGHMITDVNMACVFIPDMHIGLMDAADDFSQRGRQVLNLSLAIELTKFARNLAPPIRVVQLGDLFDIWEAEASIDPVVEQDAFRLGQALLSGGMAPSRAGSVVQQYLSKNTDVRSIYYGIDLDAKKWAETINIDRSKPYQEHYREYEARRQPERFPARANTVGIFPDRTPTSYWEGDDDRQVREVGWLGRGESSKNTKDLSKEHDALNSVCNRTLDQWKSDRTRRARDAYVAIHQRWGPSLQSWIDMLTSDKNGGGRSCILGNHDIELASEYVRTGHGGSDFPWKEGQWTTIEALNQGNEINIANSWTRKDYERCWVADGRWLAEHGHRFDEYNSTEGVQNVSSVLDMVEGKRVTYEWARNERNEYLRTREGSLLHQKDTPTKMEIRDPGDHLASYKLTILRNPKISSIVDLVGNIRTTRARVVRSLMATMSALNPSVKFLITPKELDIKLGKLGYGLGVSAGGNRNFVLNEFVPYTGSSVLAYPFRVLFHAHTHLHLFSVLKFARLSRQPSVSG